MLLRTQFVSFVWPSRNRDREQIDEAEKNQLTKNNNKMFKLLWFSWWAKYMHASKRYIWFDSFISFSIIIVFHFMRFFCLHGIFLRIFASLDFGRMDLNERPTLLFAANKILWISLHTSLLCSCDSMVRLHRTLTLERHAVESHL